MGLAANARFLVATESRVSGVGVVAVGPDPTGLDGAAHAVGDVAVAAPDAGTQAVERVVGNGQRVGFVLEGGHGQHRAEDFFLEDAHFVVALEQGRLHVVAADQVAFHLGLFATNQHLRAFLLAQLEVGQNFCQLLFGGLGADHGVGIERVALHNDRHAFEDTFHEGVVNAFLNQGAAGAGAHLALVEGKQHQAFDGFVQKTVVLVHDVGKEHVG